MWICQGGGGKIQVRQKIEIEIFRAKVLAEKLEQHIFVMEMSQIPALPSHVRAIHEIRTESAYKEEASDATAEIEMELTA